MKTTKTIVAVSRADAAPIAGFLLAGLTAAVLSLGASEAQAASAKAPVKPAPVVAAKPAPAAVEAEVEDDGFEVEDAFGFSQGAATAGEGKWEASSTLTGAFGRSKGSYRAFQTESEAEYGITDRIQMGFAAFTDAHRVRNVPQLDNISSFGFDGLSVSPKIAILQKDIDGPVGFAVEGELEWRRHDEASGQSGRFYQGGLTALSDWVVMPNTLYAAANAGFELGRGRENGEAWETESSVFASGALSWRFTKRATIGAEARLESAFEDVFGKREGTALFLGPTFFWKISGKVSVAAAWSTQVWGNGPDSHGRLNLDAFDRHRGMLKIGLEF
ncbi:hypothetical protein [Prosthecomicrobium hirschii]|uniref:hypothetical protein n=1 Tax=Prosthecodimorpha hirschii TaxID=665126 RepID=UPI0022207AC1|nr:hypothetical protein [Prosthecomicrobium hirschii]MCW1839155.1 hypothetical protein [Prosthecomicrobium hirschii]